MTLDDIATPFGVVELDTLESNISAMDQRLRSSHIANRPHIKVHRLPDIGRMQTEGGASGIACQTVDEAETMVTNGFNEIMLTNSFVGSLKLRSILALASRASISLTADSTEAVTELSQLSEATGQRLIVYVECDIGGLRSGFTEPQEAANLAVTVTRSPRLEFGGLAAYLGGNPQCDDISAANALLEDVITQLGHDGVGVPAVSVGGTVFAMRGWPDCPPQAVTEARPGNYAFFDATKVAYGLVTYNDCSLRVFSTVVSRPNSTRVVLDAGWRILSYIYIPTPGEPTYGHVLEYPEARTVRLYTEHALVELPVASSKPRIGDRVTIVPNSCDGVLASLSSLHGIRDHRVERTWRLRSPNQLQQIEPHLEGTTAPSSFG